MKKTKKKIYNDGFQNGIIKQAKYHFEKRGFSDNLDKGSNILGVGNGVLLFENGKANLVRHYNDYNISKYTDVDYHPYDPSNPYITIIENMMHDIYIEEDAYEWILLYFASSLTIEPKDIMLLSWGIGSTGKSTMAEWIKVTFGFQYARKIPINLITDSKEKADGANSALMSISGLLFAYGSESSKGQMLNSSRVKELVSPEAQTGRELYGRQGEFYNKATLYFCTNNPIMFDNPFDDAMWRRFRAYNHKCKFTKNPDPNNPYEKAVNEKYSFKYVNDKNYKEAVLSILVHWKLILDNKYDGLISNVPSKTIDADTARYRNAQDTINRFIDEQMYKCEGSSCTLYEIAREYKSWFLSMYANRATVVSDMDAIVVLFTQSSLKNNIVNNYKKNSKSKKEKNETNSINHNDSTVTGWKIRKNGNNNNDDEEVDIDDMPL